MSEQNDQLSDDQQGDGNGDQTISLSGEPSCVRACAQPLRPWMKAFIAEFEHFGIIGDACREAKVSWDTVKKYRESDPQFGAAYEAALRAAVDKVERRGMEIAGKGTQRAIYHQGIVVGYETVYDTGMIQFMLKKRRPEEYADKMSLEVSGTVNHLHVHATPDQLADRVRGLLPSLTERVMKVLPTKSDSQE